MAGSKGNRNFIQKVSQESPVVTIGSLAPRTIPQPSQALNLVADFCVTVSSPTGRSAVERSPFLLLYRTQRTAARRHLRKISLFKTGVGRVRTGNNYKSGAWN